MKNEIAKKILKEISPSEGFEISKEEVVSIVNKKFPDFRSILIELDNYKQTGYTLKNTSSLDLKVKFDLFNLLFDETKNFENIYHFIIENFGAERIDNLIELLGKPFFDYCIENKKTKTENLFDVANIITEKSKLLETSPDPIIVGISTIGKIRNLLIK